MVISDKIKRVATCSDFVLWAGNVGKEGICDLTRVSGFMVEEDGEHITFFLPEKLFSLIEPNLQTRSVISLLMASVQDFESYQVKGTYVKHGPCSSEIVDFYSSKVSRVVEVITGLGIDATGIFDYLLDQPSVAVTILCNEMYVQTPKPGTGGKLTNQEP